MNIYDIKVENINKQEIKLEEYKGKALLIVNTASKCGFTPQYEGLEELYQKYKQQGLEVLGFPCDQFGNQEPGNEEDIKSFCSLNFGVTFPMFAKIEVNGDNTHPLYQHLKSQKGGLLGSNIKWNFTKFLVDKQGKVVGRYGSTKKPKDLEKEIEKVL